MAPEQQPQTTNTTFVLPLSIVSRTHVSHLARELEAIDAFLEQARMRKSGTAVALPRMSKTLEELVSTSGLNLLQTEDRQRLRQFVKSMKAEAPVLHISFATEPTAAFLQKLTQWLRIEIHPLLLVQVGLQPNITAGCTVRTKNKYFDFSLRKHLQAHRGDLVTLLRESASE